MKYYNIELFPSMAEKLQQFLYDLLVKFEISAAGPMIHFEILTDAAGADVGGTYISFGGDGGDGDESGGRYRGETGKRGGDRAVKRGRGGMEFLRLHRRTVCRSDFGTVR